MRNPAFFSKPLTIHFLILFSLGLFSNLAGAAQTVTPATAQTTPPYKDPTRPIEERIKDLLSRMTKEEKFWQLFMIPGDLDNATGSQYNHGLFGFQVSAGAQGDAAGQLLHYSTTESTLALNRKINALQKYFLEQTRLGIPIIPFDEALHGLVRAGATAFPQAIGLAATWDTTLVGQVAGAIATETKIRGIRQILTPVINIAADPRWGRTEETYGEDPFLCSEIAVAFVQPFETAGIITTPKHFIANVGDGGRDSYPIHYNERLLDEIYFPPFRAVIERAGARSLMTAYNSLDGTPCTANDWLLNKKLKGEWKFKGFVISDASATGGANVLHFTAKDYPTSGQQAITGGLDVIFQTEYEHYKLFIPPFLDGSIAPERIDDAVARVLRAKFELGLFENPYIPETEAIRWAKDSTHKVIARQAALESIVLLKNEKKTLPLNKSVRTLAVIGEDAMEARLGGYSGPGNGKISILDGLRKRAGATTKISYSPGCGRNSEQYAVIPTTYLSNTNEGIKKPGLKGEYFNNITLSDKPALTRIDAALNFQWTLFPPAPVLSNDFYSVRWTGKLRAPETGTVQIGLEGNDGYRLYINDKLVIDNWKKQTYSTILTDFHFEKDAAYAIRVEFFEPAGNAHLKLIWNYGVPNDWKARISEAVAAARQADVAVIVAGIEEGEFRDRALLNLPGHQEELIRQVAAAGKPVIVLLSGGSAITMNAWLDKVPAVLAIWYPGEEGGNAVAKVLFGDYNPGGRLPITYPMSEAQLPLVYNHKPTGRGDDYNNLSGLPLFPFGFGLSYTHFEYSDWRLAANNISIHDSTTVSCKVKNTGDQEGDEVVQLYIRDLLSSVATPVMALKGFSRVHLLPGQTKEVSFMLTPSMLSLLNEKLESVTEPGDFRIMVGASSRDLRLKGTLTLQP
ncbi:MAG TPA: glycoside hydrolase family 3 C-terminal domain-containing protein [Puia sp.]|nr:glycoside hydrolase family 3 C-terminal domain-containing protein [Puia sp.]